MTLVPRPAPPPSTRRSETSRRRRMSCPGFLEFHARPQPGIPGRENLTQSRGDAKEEQLSAAPRLCVRPFRSPCFRVVWFLLFAILAGAAPVSAQSEAPPYNELCLESLFPAGGRIGTSVEVEFRTTRADLFGPRRVMIDGPPGVTARDVKTDKNVVRAVLEIAPDAAPGRREVRLLGDRVGLTNMLYFTVGTLPEVIEDPARDRHDIDWPCVVNGRIDPDTDADRYVFTARADKPLVLWARAHALDSHGQGKHYGFVDLDLRVLDASGRVVAEARDTLGLDPLLELRVPADGRYTAVVEHVLYRGYPQAVYRLLVTDSPVPTALFPAGTRQGDATTARLFGPLVPEGTTVTLSGIASPLPFGRIGHPATAGVVDLPFVIGDGPESVEAEPNDDRATASLLPLGGTANARFDRPGDHDWYRLDVSEPGPIEVSTLAHRWLRSPVDTTIEIFDAEGKLVGQNDDGFPIEYMSIHDIEPPDSRVVFRAERAGTFFARVYEQTGAAGERAVYRLTAQPARPDFQLLSYPDGVPIWGPGSTAALVVKVLRDHDFVEDIDLSIEGLPDGWRGSRATNIAPRKDRPSSSFYNHFGLRTFLTITAPPGAQPGDLTEFRVVGRATSDGAVRERIARPLAWYFTSDIGLFRMSSVQRAVVAEAKGAWLETDLSTVTGKPGETVSIPFRVRGAASDPASLVVAPNLATAGVACVYNAPQAINLTGGAGAFPLRITPETPPGEFYFALSRSWGGDIRVGMPAPCTPLIKLVVQPP